MIAQHSNRIPPLRGRAWLMCAAALALTGAGTVMAPPNTWAEENETSSFLAPMTEGSTAQMSGDAELVQSIQIEGAQRLETETVMSYLTLSKGDLATAEKLDASLKTLYATGLFADARLIMDDGTLIVTVEENPIINRVAFEGNDAVTKEDLEKEVQIRARQVYTLPRAQRDVQRILDLYRRSGRFAAVVTPKIVKLDQNRVDLVFEISEGQRTGVRNIAFVGNRAFDESDLREVINTRESAWWRIFSSSDYYDPDRLSYDKETLRKYYLTEGYVDFRVLSGVAELTPDRGDFFITFTIDEGPRYRFGKISIKSEIKGVDGESFRAMLLTKNGDWYNSEQVEKTITKLTNLLGDRQYAFVQIVPDITRNKDSLTVDLTYDIKQGERVYIGRIDVSGNNNTVDKVIRRQMQLAEGDPFNVTKVHKSEQNLKDLGFFEEAKVTPSDGAQPDRANLKVEVKEKSTGEVSIGAGFSSTDGPLGDFSISEHNFMGQGQDVRFGATVSGRTKQVDTSFTEPYFLDRDLSAGVDAFRTQTDYQDLSSYDTTSTGFGLRLGYALSPEVRQRLNYSFHNDTITNVPSTASLYVVEQQGTTITSSVGQEIAWDTRDSRLEPTLGFITRLNTDVAGAGGSRKWLKAKLTGTQYYPIAERWIISGTAEAGQIWGLDGPTRINERFFLGGDSLRGFAYAGLGPRDINGENQDALGSSRYLRGTTELTMPTPLPPEFGLKAHIFVDGAIPGSTGEGSIIGSAIASNESLRLSSGIGMTWVSPFGPVRLDLAKAILRESYDKTELIHFSFGTKF
ncbi:MAG: outer membrane protein assembly factor BamA [Bdellovibrionales bacterium]